MCTAIISHREGCVCILARRPISFDYEALLPLDIPHADLGRVWDIPFSIADDCQNRQVESVQLRIGVLNLVSDSCVVAW